MRKVNGVLLPWDRTTWLHQWWEVDRTLQGNNDESGEVTKTKLLASLSKECHFKDAGFSFHLNMIGIEMNSKMPFQGCRVPNLPWHLRGKASVPEHEEQVWGLFFFWKYLEIFFKASWKFLESFFEKYFYFGQIGSCTHPLVALLKKAKYANMNIKWATAKNVTQCTENM